MKKLFAIVSVVVLAIVPARAGDETSVHDFTLTSIEYIDMPMDQYAGKAILIVNTASECGYTPQYEGLQALWTKYRDQGLVVLGIPANDFLGQEPGDEKAIKEFCEVNFNVDFPMTKKMVVKKGKKTSEFYEFLASQLGDKSRPKWNFHKYLINTEGTPVAYFKSKVKPMSDELTAAIEAVLPKG